MTADRSWAPRQFDHLKSADITAARALAVTCDGSPSVRLVPVGPWILEDDHLISSMAHWRAAARDMYFAQFPESTAGMRRYLSEVSIGRADAVLFVIEGASDARVGHIGLTHGRADSAEVDSVMKSSHGAPPGTMSRALSGLISWSTEIGLSELTLRVLSYNSRAISLYLAAGFMEIERRALLRKEGANTVSHEEVDSRRSNVDYECVVMRRFLKHHAGH